MSDRRSQSAASPRETILKHGLRDVLLIGAGHGIRHTMTDKAMVGAMMDVANATLEQARAAPSPAFPACPFCGGELCAVTRTREELDAQALRDHIAANPTPPSGPTPGWEKVESDGELAPPKTTVFRKPDGSPLITITLRHTLSWTTRLRRRDA